MLSPCLPPNETYLEQLDLLQTRYFPSPTRPAFPRVEYKRPDLEKLEFYVTVPWGFRWLTEHAQCEQYEHELWECAWPSVRDVTDAVMNADDHVTWVTVASWDRIEHFLELLRFWKGN